MKKEDTKQSRKKLDNLKKGEKKKKTNMEKGAFEKKKGKVCWGSALIPCPKKKKRVI